MRPRLWLRLQRYDRGGGLRQGLLGFADLPDELHSRCVTKRKNMSHEFSELLLDLKQLLLVGFARCDDWARWQLQHRRMLSFT